MQSPWPGYCGIPYQLIKVGMEDTPAAPIAPPWRRTDPKMAHIIIRLMVHARGRDGPRASGDDGFT